MIVDSGATRANLATSTCERTLSVDGTLKEIVLLNGGLEGEELERFIESFPIREVAGW